jgi:hypothetical protein
MLELKVLDVDFAIPLLQMLAKDRFPEMIPKFCEFLQEKNIKGLNSDQWTCLLTFCKIVKDVKKDYDPDDAWPTLIDSFVEWLSSK